MPVKLFSDLFCLIRFPTSSLPVFFLFFNTATMPTTTPPNLLDLAQPIVDDALRQRSPHAYQSIVPISWVSAETFTYLDSISPLSVDFMLVDFVELGDLESIANALDAGCARWSTAKLREKQSDIAVSKRVFVADADTNAVRSLWRARTIIGLLDMNIIEKEKAGLLVAKWMNQAKPSDPAAFSQWRRDLVLEKSFRTMLTFEKIDENLKSCEEINNKNNKGQYTPRRVA